jgi:hypothetical protein
VAKSRIDKLIDQAESTNEAIRQLTMLVLPLLTAGAPPPVKKAVQIAPQTNEMIAEGYFDVLRGFASVAQDPRVQETALRAVRPRTAAQKRNDKMQSKAFAMANSKLRNQNGSLKKGKTQADVATRAQKELKKMKGPMKSRKASPSTRGKSPSRKPRGRRGTGRR